MANIYSGETNVTTAGTPVALSGAGELVSFVTAQAKEVNTGKVYVMGPGATGKIALLAGDSYTFPVMSWRTLYDLGTDVRIDADVSGEGVEWLAGRREQ